MHTIDLTIQRFCIRDQVFPPAAIAQRQFVDERGRSLCRSHDKPHKYFASRLVCDFNNVYYNHWPHSSGLLEKEGTQTLNCFSKAGLSMSTQLTLPNHPIDCDELQAFLHL
jgi:hypothetical protein